MYSTVHPNDVGVAQHGRCNVIESSQDPEKRLISISSVHQLYSIGSWLATSAPLTISTKAYFKANSFALDCCRGSVRVVLSSERVVLLSWCVRPSPAVIPRSPALSFILSLNFSKFECVLLLLTHNSLSVLELFEIALNVFHS